MKPIDQLSDDDLGRALRSALHALADVPPALTRSAVALFDAAPSGPLVQARQVLRQVRASLSFDSWATSGLAHGMRGLRAPTRHLLYSAEGRDIDMRISPAGPGYALAGQILGPGDSGSIRLVPQHECGAATPDEAARSAQLDALGEFRIDGLVAGAYAVTLTMDDAEILLPTVEVGG